MEINYTFVHARCYNPPSIELNLNSIFSRLNLLLFGAYPSIELNSNSIFSGRKSDATQSCNSIELNHFWWYRNALKAQYRLSPCPDPPLTLPRGNVRVTIGYRLGIDWKTIGARLNRPKSITESRPMINQNLTVSWARGRGRVQSVLGQSEEHGESYSL